MTAKRPFHEVIAEKLAGQEIRGPVHSTQAGGLMVLLTILRDSKMPAEAAHQIARANNTLPNILESIGDNKAMAKLARDVFTDLVNRRDEASDRDGDIALADMKATLGGS